MHAPETRQYLLDLMEQHYAQIKECFGEALVCIHEAVQARRIHILKDGTNDIVGNSDIQFGSETAAPVSN